MVWSKRKKNSNTNTENASCLLNIHRAHAHRRSYIWAENIHNSTCFPTAGSLKLYIGYTAWFFPLPSKLHEKQRAGIWGSLHKLGGSPPSPIFSPCQPLCVDKTIYLYHFPAGRTGEGLEGTQGGGVREEVMVSLVVKGHWSAGLSAGLRGEGKSPRSTSGMGCVRAKPYEVMPKWRLIEGNGYWRPNHSATPSVTLKPVHSFNVRSRGRHLASSADH